MSNSTEKQNVPQMKASAKDTVLWVGIDWADQKHCVATRRPDGSDSKLHWVDQKPQKLDEFFLELQKQHLTGHIGVVLEQSRGALLYALLKYSFLELYPINPRCLADFRKAMAASGAKSAGISSQVLLSVDPGVVCGPPGRAHRLGFPGALAEPGGPPKGQAGGAASVLPQA